MSPTAALLEEEVALQEILAPPVAPPMSPIEKLRLLEKKALEKGISREVFEDIKNIGDCSVQVQSRIANLEDWLAIY
ncbi:MAG: hypothetical protein AAB469_01015 [Patescibacteria group bacterium]